MKGKNVIVLKINLDKIYTIKKKTPEVYQSARYM